MGPRFFKRGDQGARDSKARASQLQWGHASLSVETGTGELAEDAGRADRFNGATLL